MGILLVLCVGAVSAADTADMVDGGVSDVSVSPVSEDISVLSEDTLEDVENPPESDGDAGDSDVDQNNITISANENSISFSEDKNITFDVDVKNNSESIAFTQENIKLLLYYNDNKDSVNITEFTLNDKSISFIIPEEINNPNSVFIFYQTDVYDANTSIELKKSMNPVIEVLASINVNIDTKNVTFEIKVSDKNGTTIEVNKEDFKLVLDYLDGNNTKTINITDFTFNNGTISFKLNKNVTSSNLTIFFKKGTIYETKVVTTLNPIIDAEIKVLIKESATEYQHNYIVVQLVNTVTGKAISGKTIYYQLVNASMGIRWGYTTDKNGKCNVSLDYIYSLGAGYIPVGKYYTLIVSAGDNVIAKGQNCTINITKSKCTFTANNYSSTYASGKKFIIKVTKNSDKKAAINARVKVRVYFSSKSYQDLELITNGSGIGTIGVNLGSGKYKVVIAMNDGNFSASKITRYINVVGIKNAKISAKATTAYYNCGSKFKVKMVNSKGVVLKGASVLLNVYTGNKYKAVTISTDDKGYAYWSVSGISIGKHRVLIGSGSTGATANVVQTYITVKKGKTIVTAPKVTNGYKKSAYFKVTVKTSGTKKALKGIYLNVKVYTGKKYKTYKIKTNSKGVASLNTKALTKGTHKVVISSTNKYYTISKSGDLIVITK